MIFFKLLPSRIVLNGTKIILFRIKKNFKSKYVVSGIEVIRNKTGFGTAVHQLILAQTAPIPDDIPSLIVS